MMSGSLHHDQKPVVRENLCEPISLWSELCEAPERVSSRPSTVSVNVCGFPFTPSPNNLCLFDATPSVFFYPAQTDIFANLASPVCCPVSHKETWVPCDMECDGVQLRESEELTFLSRASSENDVTSENWSENRASDVSAHARISLENISTLMLQGIPNKLTRDMIRYELEVLGFKDDIDFFYVPGDSIHQRNVGYCFVNLTTPEAVQRFHDTLEGASLGFGKTCHVGIGKVQGLEANIAAYCSPGITQEAYEALVFINGVEILLTRSAPEVSDTALTNTMDYTSLMLRHIPNTFSRRMLLQEMESRGLMADIDFFYVPVDFRRHRNVGYCFVNLTTVEGAKRFKEAFTGVLMGGKTCDVCAAQVQGLASNIEVYRNNAIMSMREEYRPVLFADGARIPFPPPTKKLRRANKKIVTSKLRAKISAYESW